MKKVLNIAIVGCGYWGPNLVRNFSSLSESIVLKSCDSDSQRLKHMKKLYPDIETTSSYDDLINDSEIEAIAIATPVHSHF